MFSFVWSELFDQLPQMEDKINDNSSSATEGSKGLKRAASDLEESERPIKRARTDPDGTVGESGFNSLSKDMLTEISYHLDIISINTMFSASKTLRNHISWHESTTPEFWRQLFQRKYPDYALQLPEDHEEGDTLPWRDIFIGTERKRTFAPKRLQNFIQMACLDPKNGNNAAELLDNTRKILAKLEFQQTLLDQVESFLQKNPSMRTFWDSRVLYTLHQVFAGVEWSIENYKWDVTNTAPVRMTIVGKNGKALFLDLMTSYFACYWGYGLHKFVKHEVMSVFEVSSAMEWDIEPSKECTEDGLMPKTPSDDNDEDKIVKALMKLGWEYFKDESKWKELLDEIGLSDVDPKLFYSLINCAAFPDAKGQYYTETKGYYASSSKFIDERNRYKLPGIGGEANWGRMPPPKTAKSTL